MQKKILKKRYCRITFRLASPMAVGSGESSTSDRNILRDARGEPYLPATAIAGVCRSFFLEEGKLPDEAKPYFGCVEINRGQEPKKRKQQEAMEQIESALVFHDARILYPSGQVIKSSFHTTVRDSVRLDDYKNAEPGGKFDMEVLEPGVKMRTYIEQNILGEGDIDYIARIVEILCSGETHFGAKSMRGYGAIDKVTAEVVVFDLREKRDVEAWLEFDPQKEKSWTGALRYGAGTSKQALLRLDLKQREGSGISIRKYTTEAAAGDGLSVPDFSQLTVHMGDEIRPVIPGTSWAGAVRHRMKELGLKSDDVKALFGYVNGEGDKQRSRIRFSESQIRGGSEKELSRNAIDRFSGGTVDGALFTERTWYGGRTQLSISLVPGAVLSDSECRILAAVLADMHYGFLPVGGETSVGRGLFEIEKVNGKALSKEERSQIYQMLLEQVRCSLGSEK